MLPYFPTLPALIEELKVYLVSSSDEDTMVKLQIRLIHTLAKLVWAIGKEHFTPFANDIKSFALEILKKETIDISELKLSLYNLFGALSEVLNDGMAPFLSQIVGTMTKEFGGDGEQKENCI